MVKKHSKNTAKMWYKYGKNMWYKYGKNMAKIQPIYGRNMIEILP